MIKQLLFAVLITINFSAFSATPDIVNFSTKDYNWHSINYCFAQDSNGVRYIGNAYGILEYDGRSWRKVGISDGKSALSLVVNHEGKIFAGSSSEFGYLSKNSKGQNEYVSLKSILPNDEIGEILDLVAVDHKIYFRTLYSVYLYENNIVTQITPEDHENLIYSLEILNGKVVAFQHGKGLLEFSNNKNSIQKTPFDKQPIRHVLQFEDGIEYVSEKKIYSDSKTIINTIINEKIKDTECTSTLQLNANEFLIGTVSKGLFHVNTSGEIISNYTTSHGLPGNYIRSLYLDDAGNLWIAYNNGIGIIKWNSPLTYVSKTVGIEGMGYCSAISGDTLYVGTSRGIFFLPQWKTNIKGQTQFKAVEGISGTINDLVNHQGSIIACQNAETYTVKGKKAIRISSGHWYGSWAWRGSTIDSNEAFVSTNLGLARYEKINNSWKLTNHIKNFEESGRVLEMDARGIFWVIQGNKGLYRVELNAERDSAIQVTNYKNILGVDPQHFNDIFKWNDSILIATYGQTYYLDQDSLIALSSFAKLGKKSERIRKFSSNGIYSIDDDQAHILENKGGKWQVQNTPVSFSKSPLVGSAEYFEELESGIHILGTQDGFAIYSKANNNNASETACLIRRIELLNSEGDSLIYSDNPVSLSAFPYEYNNLRIAYSIPLFGENDQVRYETKLEKNNKLVHNWKGVQEVNFKEYTNLKEGEYTFLLRAKKGDETVGKTSFQFEILPPWYRTKGAYFIYFILILIGIYFVYQIFLKQGKKLEEQNRLELEIKEKLHRAEKLELELKNKENELAYVALNYTQKKDLLGSLTSELNKISKDLKHEDQIKFRSVKSAIANNLDDESNWQNFQVHFDEKNDNFFQKLKQKEKRMNESYLLFCSYVRMGKSNKEIAELLNLSVAAVEKRKYRLKKKWDLPDDTSFTEYLRNL